MICGQSSGKQKRRLASDEEEVILMTPEQDRRIRIIQSDTYRRFLETGEPEVTDEVRERYHALTDISLSRPLTPDEETELQALRVEMDASDFASCPPDKSWLRARTCEHREVQRKLDAIKAQLAVLDRSGE
jgi:hypothetical protein